MVVLIPVIALIVLALGGVYAVFLRRAARDGTGWKAVALTGCVAGIAAVALTALAAVMSFTSLLEATPLNGPLGLVAFAGIPAALVGVACGALRLRSASRGPGVGVAGLVLSVFSVIAWVVMETAVA